MKTLIALLFFAGIANPVFSQSRPLYFQATKACFKVHETDNLSPAIDCNAIFLINGTQKEILVLSESGRVYSVVDQSYHQAADGSVLQMTTKDRNNNTVSFFWLDIKKQEGEEPEHKLIQINADKSAYFYTGQLRDVF